MVHQTDGSEALLCSSAGRCFPEALPAGAGGAAWLCQCSFGLLPSLHLFLAPSFVPRIARQEEVLGAGGVRGKRLEKWAVWSVSGRRGSEAEVAQGKVPPA